ncbi:MAG TPA: EAL domain-containing protein [Usitatibacter sp.]|nr:EAL domain-containing protein [Usitatibacter sp.]
MAPVARALSRFGQELVLESFERAAVGLAALTPDGVYLRVNRAFTELTGFAREELEGHSWREFTHPDDVAADEASLQSIRMGHDAPVGGDKRLLRKTRDVVWVRRAASVVRDAGGRPQFIIAAFLDLSEQHRKDEELRRALDEAKRATGELERHLHFTRALIDAIPNPIFFKDREGRYGLYNRAWEELFAGGRSWIGKTVHDRVDERTAREHHERDRALLERPASTTYEVTRTMADGEKRQLLFNKVSFVDQMGEVAGLIGVVTDVTAYKETEKALEASEARFRVLTESSLDLISVVDAEGTILYQSPALRSLLGYDPGETIGRRVVDLVHRDDRDQASEALTRVIEMRRTNEPVEFRLRHRNGMWRTFESLGTNCLDNPYIRGIVFNSRDVTDRKVIQQRMQHLAYHDNLTGLPNRLLFQDRLANSIARAERASHMLAVLFVDLDTFKNITDSLGHDAGDELLRGVSRRLSQCIRLEDSIARQGGDEFIVLLDTIDDSRGGSIVAQKILNALRQPFRVGGIEQHVSASVGVALYPEDGRDPQTLMKNADTAMFHAKAQGKNTYQYFTAQMNVAVKRRMTLESALRRAVMQKDFMLHYQPQVDINTGAIVAVEALVRWRSPDGIVMPADFVPLAEETGLINEVGEWVLHEACRQAQAWHDLGLERRRMAVNLSARQFSEPGFLEMVTRVLEETKLPPTSLELEITESQVMRQTDPLMALLNRLSDMGVQLAIDDFGTGYSSLSYLKRLPIQKVKIDQSFVRDLTVDPNDTAIVVAIINMARSLDLDTIAEGVETEAQLRLLQQKGCDVGQGYFFSRPLDADALLPLLRHNNLYSRS